MSKMHFYDTDFKKSSFSIPGSYPPAKCVSVAKKDGMYAVRDTKDPTKTTLVFDEGEWDAFIKGVKNNEFDV